MGYELADRGKVVVPYRRSAGTVAGYSSENNIEAFWTVGSGSVK